MLKLGEHPDGEERRQHGLTIVHKVDRQTEEVERRAVRIGLGNRGIQERADYGKRRKLIGLEAIGRRDGKRERQEIHKGIGSRVQDLIRTRVRTHEASVGKDDQQSAQQTDTRHAAQARHEDARDQVGSTLNDAAFFALVLGLGGNCAAIKAGAEQLDDLVKCILNVGADNNLILTVADNNVHDARNGLDIVSLGLVLVLKHKAQAGNAVLDRRNVVFAAYKLDN